MLVRVEGEDFVKDFKNADPKKTSRDKEKIIKASEEDRIKSC